MTKLILTIIALIWSMLLVTSCGPHKPDQQLAATPLQRQWLGPATHYEADSTLRGQLEQLQADQTRLRRVAWDTLAKILQNKSTAPSIPKWQTWYDRADIQRMLTEFARRRVRTQNDLSTPMSREEFAAVEQWNVNEIVTDPDRARRFRDTHQSSSHHRSLNGVSRALYSSELVEHLLGSANELIDCAPPPAEDDENFAPCVRGEFPVAAASIKSNWLRRRNNQVPTFATDTSAMHTLLSSSAPEWQADGAADPTAAEILTMQFPSGAAYQLTGLHLATKELREWLWITMWWSPEGDEDFGADKSVAFRQLGAPWQHYKMCVVVSYDLDDQPTWCSNPYLELGPNNAATNCIGCHQFAGTAINDAEILGHPDYGRRQTRQNFPTDYLWGTARSPDRLRSVFTEIFEHYQQK